MIEVKIITELKKHKVIPRLENNQLKLVGEVKSLSKELIDEVRENKEELIAFLFETKDNTATIESISVVEKGEYYPLSNAQKRIWVLSQFDGGNYAYNIPEIFHFMGNVVWEDFQKAINKSISRHESLRTGFKVVNNEPAQFIKDDVDFELEFETLDTTEGLEGAVKKVDKKFMNYAFNLERALLFRAKVYQINDDEAILMVNMHHIISDGWSSGVLVQEILHNYTSIRKGETNDLPELEIQYKDYSQWLTDKIEGSFGDEAKAFWKEKEFANVENINLPIDFPRPIVNDFHGSVLKFYFDKTQYEQIEDFAKSQKTTLFNVFRAVLGLSLHKWTNQNRLIIGTPVAGRSHPQLENQIGLYVNTLPLLTEFNADLEFSQYLSNISNDSLASFKFQDYPLDLILEEENIARDTSRNPLFDVMMVVQNNQLSDGSIDISQQHGFEMNYFGDLTKEDKCFKEEGMSKFDLSFSFSQAKEKGSFVEIEYKSKLFKKSTIQAFYSLFSFVMEQVIQNEDVRLKEIEILNAKEKETLLHTFNQHIQTHAEKSVIALLNKNLNVLGDKIGLIVGEESFSYTDMNNRSNTIANELVKTQTEKIGFLIERTEHVLFSVLGAMKANKTYVPIEINYPAERIEYIIKDAEVTTLLVDNKGNERVPTDFEGDILDVNELSEDIVFEITDEDLKEQTAYLIYTSGSTGEPKGVEISNKNAIAFLKWAEKEFQNTPYETLYAVTSYCFDLSVFEMLLPILHGKTIRLLSNATQISDYISKDQNILINTVPSVVRNLLDLKVDWTNVKALNMAGEPVPRIFKEQLDYNKIEIRNLYGPSEDTTYSTFYRFAADGLSYIPIGKVVGDTHLYILNDDLQLLPIGVEGEIYLSGESVAKGYYNQPALTAERFLNNPFIEGKKLYKTGDIGKWGNNGLVEFIGRLDDQVKVRGYRIELGEIQYQLEQIDQIKQAVVIIKTVREEKEIVAYYKLTQTLEVAEIKKHIQEKLPAYMVPDVFMELETIPMNANGKVDKKQLPDPEVNVVTEVVLPKNEKQKQLLEIWEEVLQAKNFGITSNFFDLGGHSLKATQLKSIVATAFSKELTLNEIFQYPTVLEQTELLETKGKRIESKIETISEEEDNAYPLSFAQERLWILNNLDEVSKAYYMPAALEIFGELKLKTLEKALNMVVERHESLRTIFKEINSDPKQVVLQPNEVLISIVEHQVNESASLQDEIINDWGQRFDLEKGPLLRVSVWQQSDRKVLSFNMHHIISDGWSIAVLFQNVLKAYSILLENKDAELAPLDIQYKDFAIWQRKEMTPKVLSEQLSYWKDEVFADGIENIDLPYDRPRPALKTYNGSSVNHIFSKSLSSAIKNQALENGASLFMGIMANVNVLLKKLANRNDITIGIPVVGRESVQLQEQIGFFVNTLPIRTKLSGKQKFVELLSVQRQQLLKAFDYQYFPFEKLVDEIQPKRDMSRSPLFDVMVTLQNFDVVDDTEIELENETHFSRLEFAANFTKYDLTFSFTEQEGALNLELEYNTDLFEKSTIKSMVNRLEEVFNRTTEKPETTIDNISVLNENEKSIIFSKADNTAVGYDKNETIVSRFAAMVDAYPGHIALKVEDKTFTYKELDLKSGQLARQLVENYNVKKEDLVVLHTTRSEWMLISILAVLKAGAAYVPIDPIYPETRIEYILMDSGTQLILSDTNLTVETSSKIVDVTSLDYSGTAYYTEIDPKQLAYMIYTSGTTGNPKGVLIEHQNVNRLLFNDTDLFDFNPSDKWSLFHSYCFDFSVWEMYGALLKGGTLVMVPKTVTQDSNAFFDFLLIEKITVLNQTPTAFRSLSNANQERFNHTDLALRYVIFGGEALMPEVLADWHKAYPSCKLVNMYGITETTVHVTYKEITPNEIVENKSNIGEPIPTLSCYVLDNDLKLTPIGVTGELCVGGAGVARGYYNREELTAERFVDDPFIQGGKIYRSGDFAKVLPNGDIEYIGRKDDQVKIRGHRIELAEVESAVKGLKGVRDALVIAFKDKNYEYELVAYIILVSELDEKTNFRTELAVCLPEYMVPGRFIEMDEFPITSNGKLDKKALPDSTKNEGVKRTHVPARNQMDEEIIVIWKEVLGLEKIGIQDNFFDLGGHSLKATRVISKIQEEFKVKIDLKDLFTDPTIKNLSDYVETVQWMNTSNEILNVETEEIIL